MIIDSESARGRGYVYQATLPEEAPSSGAALLWPVMKVMDRKIGTCDAHDEH